MQLSFLSNESREAFCLKWAGLGLYLFLSSFFWVSGPAPLRTVFYLFLVLPLLFVLPWRRWSLHEYGGYFTLSALVFAAYSVIASLWGEPEDFVFFLKQWFFLAFWLCGVAWLLYHRAINLQLLFTVIICVGVLCSLVTVYLFFIEKNYVFGARLSGFGLAENSTIVAQIFGVATLLAYLKSLQAESLSKSWAFFAAALVCAVVVLLSQTRGAILALIAVSLSALIIVRPRPQIWCPQVILVFLAVVVGVILLGANYLFEVRGTALSHRDIIWRELLFRVLEHPLFGIGYLEDARIIIPDVDVFHHAHNSWVDILYYSGLIGLGLVSWHGWLVARSHSRDKDVLPLYLWWVYGCICLFSNGSSLLTRPDAQWLMYWIPAGLLAGLIMSRRQCLPR